MRRLAVAVIDALVGALDAVTGLIDATEGQLRAWMGQYLSPLIRRALHIPSPSRVILGLEPDVTWARRCVTIAGVSINYLSPPAGRIVGIDPGDSPGEWTAIYESKEADHA